MHSLNNISYFWCDILFYQSRKIVTVVNKKNPKKQAEGNFVPAAGISGITCRVVATPITEQYLGLTVQYYSCLKDVYFYLLQGLHSNNLKCFSKGNICLNLMGNVLKTEARETTFWYLFSLMWNITFFFYELALDLYISATDCEPINHLVMVEQGGAQYQD